MNSILIAMTLSSPDPLALSNLRNIAETSQAMRGYVIELCVDEECETVDRSQFDLFDRSALQLHNRLTNAHIKSFKPSPEGPKLPNDAIGGGSVGSFVGGVVNEVLGATSTSLNLEVEVEHTAADGSNTKVKVKASGGRGGFKNPQHKANPALSSEK